MLRRYAVRSTCFRRSPREYLSGSYHDSLPTSNDSSLDVSETLLPLVTDTTKSASSISADLHVVSMCKSDDSSAYAAEICSLIDSLCG